MIELIHDLYDFIKIRGKFWLTPIILALLAIGSLIIFAQSSVIAPFIYAFF